jgi:DNA-binding beta-propeller fold protein YncE
VAPYANDYQEPIPFRLRWWFPEVYRDVGRGTLWWAIKDFAKSLTHGSTWENWWRYLRDRQPPAELGSVDSVAYFPRDYELEPDTDVEGRLVISPPPGAAGELSDPGGLAVDAAGNIYVADAGTSQVVKFDSHGLFVAAAGAPGDGEGQFNQPSDLALDAEGNVYVVDTWNHRVQKLDADLNFLAAFGKPTSDLLNPGPDEMWGPRSVALDGEGNVWVVDTGTARVRKFSAAGEPLGSVGGRGDELGQFLEPVGIAVDPESGDVLVADTGNGRIQRLRSDLTPLSEYAVEEWQDLDPNNKPDLAALPGGRVLASDPPQGRVLLIDGDGAVIAALDSVRGQPLAFPRGLAYQGEGDFVVVSESLLRQVRRFPLSDFALR